MKKLGILLMMLVTISASAQKVTRKDLNDLLLKGDTSALLDDGFKLVDTDSVFRVYSRYDSTEVIVVSNDGVMYIAKHVFHNYKRNVSMTPKGDLFFSAQDKKIHEYYIDDSNGNVTDEWLQYDDNKSVFECRMIKDKDETHVEVWVYRK